MLVIDPSEITDPPALLTTTAGSPSGHHASVEFGVSYIGPSLRSSPGGS